MSAYRSPIESKTIRDFRVRTPSGPAERRVHLFPRPDGGTTMCEPDHCRECFRERQADGE